MTKFDGGLCGLAGGNMPVYAVANRHLYGIGSGSANPAKDVFALIRSAEPILKDSVPVPYLTVCPPWSRWSFGGRNKSWK